MADVYNAGRPGGRFCATHFPVSGQRDVVWNAAGREPVRRDLEMAVSQYERAFEMDPDDPGLKKNLERAMKRLVKEADVQER